MKRADDVVACGVADDVDDVEDVEKDTKLGIKKKIIDDDFEYDEDDGDEYEVDLSDVDEEEMENPKSKTNPRAPIQQYDDDATCGVKRCSLFLAIPPVSLHTTRQLRKIHRLAGVG